MIPPDPHFLPHYHARPRWHGRQQRFIVEERAYIGITSIIQATKPQSERQRLMTWRSQTGWAAANKIASEASRRGQRLHRLVAQYFRSNVVERTQLAQESWHYWRSLWPLLDVITAPYLIEALVWHSDGYAGVLDALVEFKGELCLCDWKTATKPKRWEWITAHCLQVAAYVNAANAIYADYGIKIQQGLVAIALPNSEAQCFWLNADKLQHYQQRFDKRLAQFQL